MIFQTKTTNARKSKVLDQNQINFQELYCSNHFDPKLTRYVQMQLDNIKTMN